MSPRFATDQVGSYLRPPELIQARIAFQQGELSREGLREVEDRRIDEASKYVPGSLLPNRRPVLFAGLRASCMRTQPPGRCLGHTTPPPQRPAPGRLQLSSGSSPAEFAARGRTSSESLHHF
jgi:hypothetical protein